MKISQMEYFSCVCRCGSITKAAKELHISQPSVTAAVHELEKELGVNLFLLAKQQDSVDGGRMVCAGTH